MTFEGLFWTTALIWLILFGIILYLEHDEPDEKRHGESDTTYRG